MIFDPILSWFERRIDPFERKADYQPPRGVFAFVWHYISQARLAFAIMAVLGGLIALIEAALFYFVGRLVDVLESADRASGWAGLVQDHGVDIALMFFVIVIARFGIVTLAALLEEQTVAPGFNTLVRWQAHAHISRQSLAFFHNDFAGRIAAKVWDSGRAVGDFMDSLLQIVWVVVVYTITTLVLVGRLDWRLAAFVGIWIAVYLVAARYFIPRIRRQARLSAEASSALNGRLVDAYSNMQTLKLFGRAEENDRYIRVGFERFRNAIFAYSRYLTGVRAALTLLSGLMITAIGAFAIHLWLGQQISTGAVAFTMAMVLRLNLLLTRMMTILNAMMRNIGTIQNVAETVSQPLDMADRPDAVDLEVSRAAIRFENLSFSYGRERRVLDHLSLSIKPGEKVGLVGHSGAGKSTLVNLLLRFYDPEEGRIEIDGQDIAKVRQESLRAAIGMVCQDTSLLHRSIRENVKFGRADADAAMLMQAVERAEAWDFISRLEDQKGRKGFDAHVGERGVKLSGGQRQRIAIARVMLKDAPILVLDEATSSLDSEIEAAIQDNLDSLMEGKTVIAIAHRLSTIARMDRLVVMAEGRIVEDGTHDELIARGGIYAKLWARQSGGFLGLDADSGEAA